MKFLKIVLISTTYATIVYPQKDPRNVLLIMADDMGAMELSCYGGQINLTPNFDSLAKSGTRFETFFTTPVSTPSRVALMTGKYGTNTGHLNMADLPGGRGRGYDLSVEEYTFGQMFKDFDYRTAMAGKWQLSGKGKTLIHECGFDEYMAWIYLDNLPTGEKYKGGYYPEDSNKTSRYWHPGIMVNGKHIETKEADYGPDLYSKFLMDFMRESVAEDKPFFAYYPMTLIHTPWVGTPDNPDVEVNSPEALKANVEYSDKIIGRMISTLDDLGIRDNTLVIFIGDNGTQGWGKLTVTEWGARTPCIISCPSIVQQNVVSGEMVDLPDILTTMIEFAELTPKNMRELDGKSLMPLLTGKGKRHKEFAVSYYGNYRIVRNKEWLLESNKDESFGELYYCGNSRSGINYQQVIDFSSRKVKAAKRKFEKFIKSNTSPTQMTDEAKKEFEEFVTKNKKILERNLKERYENALPYKW